MSKLKKLTTITWIYTKYQILSKLLLFVIFFPLFNYILKALIYSTGRVTISSGDYIGFLFSPQGIGMLFLTFLFFSLVISIDINAFIIMSALIIEERIKLKSSHLLMVSIKSMKNFLKPSGIFILLYTAFVIPLVGFGLGISVTEKFKIPNFITDVIYKNPLYNTLYVSALIILAILTIIFIFFFNYLIIEDLSIKESLVSSYKLMKKHWKNFIKEFFIKTVFLYLIIFAITLIGMFLILFAIIQVKENILRRFLMIFILSIIAEIFSFGTLMGVPIVCYKLTKLFYSFNREDGKDIKLKLKVNATLFEKSNKKSYKVKIAVSLTIIMILAFDFILAAFSGVYFDKIFYTNKKIEIVAHRGGGDLAAENTILGLKEAIKNGAKWSEIDVQRTKDNKYIINHDNTFKRLCDVNKSSNELTLDEILNLKVRDLFNSNGKSQKVATLEEFLDNAKNKIGLFIELKGKTADEKMVQDVVNLVEKKHMTEEVAILSLDYNLIKYVKKHYPHIKTGYLYFFSFGDIKDVNSDFLIMEEGEATEDNINKIHNEGKKAIVWTVNTDESIHRFLNSDVDGIITDYVLKVKEAEKKEKDRSDIELIIDKIFD